MKILLLFTILNTTFIFCQNTRDDSLLYNNLWNSIVWNINIKENPEYLKFSTGNEYIAYKIDENGMPIEATTYYFDKNKVAMKSILYSNPDNSASASVDEWKFTKITYYLNGNIRSIENNLVSNKTRQFFNDKGELFYTEVIVENDTISGVFISSIDESFNIIFTVYEKGKVIERFTTDTNFNLLTIQHKKSRKKIKKWVTILQKINAKPISGI